MNQSSASDKGLLKMDSRRSQPSLSHLTKHVRYSRHLSSQAERVALNGRSRIIIHTSIRSPVNNPPTKKNQTINADRDLHSISTILTARYSQEKLNSSETNEMTRGTKRRLDDQKDFSPHSMRLQSMPNNWKNHNAVGSFRKKVVKNNNDVGEISRVQHYPSYAKEEKKRQWSNTKDIFEDSKKTKKKRKGYLNGCPCSCPCLVASLLAGLLLSIALATGLLAAFFKPQTTTTTQSTTIASTTIASTTLATTTTATTITTISATATSSTTISTTVASATTLTTSTSETTSVTTTTTDTTTSITTVTSTSCAVPTSTIGSFSSGTTTPTYTYVANFTGTAVLEFGFSSSGSNKNGYLDVVTIIDRNASNSEMLVNGGFENGTLLGWQVLCTASCSGSTGNITTSGSCLSGSYCYHDGCKGSTDFVRQPFVATMGHVYTLGFWIEIDSSQSAFVRIF